MNFGWDGGATERESFAIMDKALEHGINFFDTANVYGYGGHGDNEGVTEQVIGRWFAQSSRRDKVVLATKVFGTMGTWPNESRLSAKHIKLSCEASLRRLQTDYIDLFQMHHVDRDTPWEEVWQAMEQLVQEGKVLYIGSSNFAAWHIAQAHECARSRHLLGLVSEQSLYNLIDRTVELEVLPACEAYGLGVIPFSPLAKGVLAGGVAGARGGRRAFAEAQTIFERERSRLDRYHELCADLGEEPANIALAWVLANPVVTAPIVGPRTVEQLDRTIRATEITLEEATMQRLDEIFPGPGGAAPEAYAW